MSVLIEKIQKGYAVFGKAYEIMLRNDLHDTNSIDYQFMQEMILLTSDSYQSLYYNCPKAYDMKDHELYNFAQGLKANTERKTVQRVVEYTSSIAKSYSTPLEEMVFGGTEKEILLRGTDWCADMSRVAAVLLHLADKDEDYRGLYKGIAINEYNPILKSNNYSISRINEYYRKLLNTQHNGKWIMGEDGESCQ